MKSENNWVCHHLWIQTLRFSIFDIKVKRRTLTYDWLYMFSSSFCGVTGLDVPILEIQLCGGGQFTTLMRFIYEHLLVGWPKFLAAVFLETNRHCSTFMILFCLFPLGWCEPGWNTYNSHHYCFFTSPKKFSDAHSDCRTMGAELASIHDKEEGNFFGGKIFIQLSSSLWTPVTIPSVSWSCPDIFSPAKKSEQMCLANPQKHTH